MHPTVQRNHFCGCNHDVNTRVHKTTNSKLLLARYGFIHLYALNEEKTNPETTNMNKPSHISHQLTIQWHGHDFG